MTKKPRKEQEDKNEFVMMYSEHEKSGPNGLTIARAYRTPRSLLTEAVDELSSKPNLTYTGNLSTACKRLWVYISNLIFLTYKKVDMLTATCSKFPVRTVGE